MQKHGVPALLSAFIPGLGQLIKGQIIKAILIWIIGGVASFFFGGHGLSHSPFGLGMFMMLIMIIKERKISSFLATKIITDCP